MQARCWKVTLSHVKTRRYEYFSVHFYLYHNYYFNHNTIFDNLNKAIRIIKNENLHQFSSLYNSSGALKQLFWFKSKISKVS